MDWDDEGSELLPEGLELTHVEFFSNKNFNDFNWITCKKKDTSITLSIQTKGELLVEATPENLKKIKDFKLARMKYLIAMDNMNKAFNEIIKLA